MPPVLAFCSPAPWSRLCRRNVAAATSSSAQLQLSPATGHGHQPGQHSQPAQCHQPPTSAEDAPSSCGIVMGWVETPSKVFHRCLHSLPCSFPFDSTRSFCHQQTLLQRNYSPSCLPPSLLHIIPVLEEPLCTISAVRLISRVTVML